jgi:hypothetical protein
VAWARCSMQEGIGRIDLFGRHPDTGAMGVRTRGPDIKAGAAKFRTDRAARAEAEAVVDRWNRRLATGRDVLWSQGRAARRNAVARCVLPRVRYEPGNRSAHG